MMSHTWEKFPLQQPNDDGFVILLDDKVVVLKATRTLPSISKNLAAFNQTLLV